MNNKILYRSLSILFWFGGIFFFYWAFTSPQFRSSEGFLEGTICLPISIGIAFIIFGWGIIARWVVSCFWLSLAIIGQAVSLQLIEAGPNVGYQHYKPLSQIFAELNSFLLLFILFETIIVFTLIIKHWLPIREWRKRNFKIWQLLLIFLIFFLSSATVSQDLPGYLIELFWATFLQALHLGCILLVAWSFPNDVLASIKERLDKIFGHISVGYQNKTIKLDRFAFGIAIWVIVLAAALNFFSYERLPHVPDEAIYLFQAKYFANGSLTVPAPSVPEAFSFYMIPYKASNWYSIFPPGWPSVLAIGVLLGIPWLVNPVLAGINIILAYLFFQTVFSHRTARIGIFLLAFSPWLVFMGMNFMSHTFTLTCALTAVLAISLAGRIDKARWALIGGIATGAVSLIRPLDGLIVFIFLFLRSVGLVGRRLKYSSIIIFITSTIIVGSIIFPYNKHITGKAAIFPLAAYYEEYFGPKVNALGFGPDRGLGWAIDPFLGHGPIDALINANLNTFSINNELFGWSTGSLLILSIFLFSKRMRKEDYLMLGVIAVIAATYSLYWFSGGPDFGARYWYLMIIPLIGLTVRGIIMIQEKFVFGKNNKPINTKRVFLAIISLSILSLINFFPWRAIDKYYHYRGMRPDIRQLSKKYQFGKSLIMIRGDYSDYQSAWSYNPIDFNADAPIYAWDKNRDIRTQLLNAYPDRPVWVINGHSLTNAGFHVMSGPLLDQKVLGDKHQISYNLSFSTYFGGSSWEHARDVFADNQGNIYMVGGTASSDFPTTPGAYDRTFNPGYTGGFGPCDAFVSKFGPDGSLIWSTFLGGPGYDRAYAVEVDDLGCVYVAGRAGPGFPIKNGFQPTFNGVDNGKYGMQNAFVAKINSDGSKLVWSSYVGVATLCRDLAIDNNGDVYVPGGRWNTSKTPPAEWFINAFQKKPLGGDSDSGVIKIKGDGSEVIWATWLGGTGDEALEASIRVDANGYIYIATCTFSTDMPTTAGAHDRSINGGIDLYVAKLTPDGSELVYGTYIGDGGNNWNNTHNLALDKTGNAYISVCATSSKFPTTVGAFQKTIKGGIDWGVAKFSPTGSLLLCTLIGGKSYDNPDGIYVDDSGNVFIGGETQSTDFPGVNNNSYQSQNNGGLDAVVVILSSDFKKILYSTYIGGSADDKARSGFMAANSDLYITGESYGNGWPIKKAFQDTFSSGRLDCIVAKFVLEK